MRPALLTTILAALSTTGCASKGDWHEGQACIDIPADGTCPAAADVDPESTYSYSYCALDAKDLTGEGTPTVSPWDSGGANADPDSCCYTGTIRDADPGCVVGRPYFEGEDPTLAALDGVVPHDPTTRAWLHAALGEHASVAAFARLTLDLMALGAPMELLAEVQAAGGDEVVHAQLCFDVASELSGAELSPGRFGFREPIVPSGDLVATAVATAREGCLGETVGAWLAERAAERVEDAAIASVLRVIADDEARHAALSWKIVAWCIEQGGEEVREAVREALREPFPVGGIIAELAGDSPEVLLGACVEAVIEPAAKALLAA